MFVVFGISFSFSHLSQDSSLCVRACQVFRAEMTSWQEAPGKRDAQSTCRPPQTACNMTNRPCKYPHVWKVLNIIFDNKRETQRPVGAGMKARRDQPRAACVCKTPAGGWPRGDPAMPPRRAVPPGRDPQLPNKTQTHLPSGVCCLFQGLYIILPR